MSQLKLDTQNYIKWMFDHWQLFDLGEDGKGMSRVAAISQQTTLQNSALVARWVLLWKLCLE